MKTKMTVKEIRKNFLLVDDEVIELFKKDIDGMIDFSYRWEFDVNKDVYTFGVKNDIFLQRFIEANGWTYFSDSANDFLNHIANIFSGVVYAGINLGGDSFHIDLEIDRLLSFYKGRYLPLPITKTGYHIMNEGNRSLNVIDVSKASICSLSNSMMKGSSNNSFIFDLQIPGETVGKYLFDKEEELINHMADVNKALSDIGIKEQNSDLFEKHNPLSNALFGTPKNNTLILNKKAYNIIKDGMDNMPSLSDPETYENGVRHFNLNTTLIMELVTYAPSEFVNVPLYVYTNEGDSGDDFRYYTALPCLTPE